MERSLCGLALVKCQASSFPQVFSGFRAHHCAGVTDIPVGQIIFCLPHIPSDGDWRAVIVNLCSGETEFARLTWVHPDCLVPLGPEAPQDLGLETRRDFVSVDLTEGRGTQA